MHPKNAIAHSIELKPIILTAEYSVMLYVIIALAKRII